MRDTATIFLAIHRQFQAGVHISSVDDQAKLTVLGWGTGLIVTVPVHAAENDPPVRSARASPTGNARKCQFQRADEMGETSREKLYAICMMTSFSLLLSFYRQS